MSRSPVIASVVAIVLVWFGQTALGQSVRESNTSAAQAHFSEPTPGTLDPAQVERLILAEANEFRGREHRLPLRTNPKLADAANYFAHYLASTEKFSHTADGREPWERAEEHGYRYCIILENIAYEFNSEGFTAQSLADGFMQSWKQSPGHRRNLLDPDVSDTGIGVAHNPATGYYYAVQMFGRPRSQAIVFQVANRTETTVPFTLDKHREKIRPGYTMTYTRCRPPRVDFRSAGNPAVFHPKGGAHLSVVPAGGGYQVRQE